MKNKGARFDLGVQTAMVRSRRSKIGDPARKGRKSKIPDGKRPAGCGHSDHHLVNRWASRWRASPVLGGHEGAGHIVTEVGPGQLRTSPEGRPRGVVVPSRPAAPVPDLSVRPAQTCCDLGARAASAAQRYPTATFRIQARGPGNGLLTPMNAAWERFPPYMVVHRRLGGEDRTPSVPFEGPPAAWSGCGVTTGFTVRRFGNRATFRGRVPRTVAIVGVGGVGMASAAGWPSNAGAPR